MKRGKYNSQLAVKGIAENYVPRVIQKYNKEYSLRPEVIAWAKVRNSRPERRAVRNAYKKTEKGKEINRQSRKRNWEKNAPLREKHLLWRYGLTPDGYKDLLEEQNGVCAICNRSQKSRLHVDHCHETGLVRGLLCGSCNRALGLMKDSTEFLLKAIQYLQK